MVYFLFSTSSMGFLFLFYSNYNLKSTVFALGVWKTRTDRSMSSPTPSVAGRNKEHLTIVGQPISHVPGKLR